MQPQCVLADRMRAEHEFDEDGLCECGERRTSFAPRPELRPVVPPQPRRQPAPARPASPSDPVRPAPSPEKRIGGTAFSALLAELERHRAQIDEAIAALRKVEGWWPGS
jgi:hypothetical protein